MAYCDWKSYKAFFDPRLLFDALRGQPHLFFLDSSLRQSASGRYSFLGASPFEVLSPGDADPCPGLRRALGRYRLGPGAMPFPLMCGAVGFFSYDLGFQFEPNIIRRLPAAREPAYWIGLYNTVFVFDHIRRTVSIVVTGAPEMRDAAARLCARENLRAGEKLLAAVSGRAPLGLLSPHGHKKIPRQPAPASNTRRQEYISAVKRAQTHIRAGDIYQVNIAQRFSARTALSAGRLYNRLREVSPACFSAFLDAGDIQMMSSSPERFLALRGEVLSTRPMKGTRPRAARAAGDSALRRELIDSAKEAAELTMIVDLMRNDLGKVCRYGSVRVPCLRELEEYATVFQMTATVEGRIRPDCGPVDIIRACFPGGSITGCPKLRAMEIIETIEKESRGLYTGALGYLSFSGDMDLSMVIRTIVKQKERIGFGVGSGIVADSDPAAEYEETLVKAAGIFRALEEA